MSTVEKSIDVDVPITEAYGQWTQFEEFPRFMEGVESIAQLDETHLHWVASIDGIRREWDAAITEQHPDERIAWSATSGVTNAGVVTFHRIADNKTRIMLQLDMEPEGLLEKVGTSSASSSGKRPETWSGSRHSSKVPPRPRGVGPAM